MMDEVIDQGIVEPPRVFEMPPTTFPWEHTGPYRFDLPQDGGYLVLFAFLTGMDDAIVCSTQPVRLRSVQAIQEQLAEVIELLQAPRDGRAGTNDPVLCRTLTEIGYLPARRSMARLLECDEQLAATLQKLTQEELVEVLFPYLVRNQQYIFDGMHRDCTMSLPLPLIEENA